MMPEEILTPKDLGLPDKFTEWRDGQAEAIEAVVRSGKTFFYLDAPTGVGKSAIGVASYERISLIQAMLNRMSDVEDQKDLKFRCIYVCRTKQLQDQILHEFPWAKTIKGRGNYPCLLRPGAFPDYSAEDCTHNKSTPCPDETRIKCPYLVTKFAAMRAKLAVLNDSYFLAEANGPAQFSGANMVVLDEGDTIEQALMNFIQLEIGQKQLEYYKLRPPPDIDDFISWRQWIQYAQAGILQAQNETGSQLDFGNPAKWTKAQIETSRRMKRMTNFLQKLIDFEANVDSGWIMTHMINKDGSWKISFKPVLTAPYAEKYLWKHGERFLIMSGTILDPKMQARDTGVPEEDYDYMQMDSPFPAANRPIYYNPVVSLKRDTMEHELPILANEVTDIVSRYPNDRILVHTVNYRIQKFLWENIPPPYAERLMQHSSLDREQKLAEFKSCGQPAVMLSPSFDRGVDLPDDLCRCQIICKVPYLDMSDKQVKARMDMPDGQRWYLIKALQTLMQMTGRIVRSKTDHGDTWILDKAFDRLFARVKYAIPQWWQDAIMVRRGEKWERWGK